MPALSAITVLVLVASLFFVFAAASVLWGVDSRPGLGDDHAR